jgi:hypothetical protein
MMSKYSFGSRAMSYRRGARRLGLCALTLAAFALAQAQGNPQQPGTSSDAGKTVGKYVVHQSLDVGGHIAENSGSPAMYATLVTFTPGLACLISH